MNVVALIPARYNSSRFPGKPLAMIKGKSMIRRVVEQASKVEGLLGVYVATDDQRILDHVEEFGGKAILTGEHHLNGTSRCLEAMNKLTSEGVTIDAVINIQGDEPLIQPGQIQSIIGLLEQDGAQIATLKRKISDSTELFNANVVKVVSGQNNAAIYFSRQAIPFLRGVAAEKWIEDGIFFKHIGIYGYSKDALIMINKLEPGNLEEAESLEQLRWLENGMSIRIAETDFDNRGIDTPEDLEKLKSLLDW